MSLFAILEIKLRMPVTKACIYCGVPVLIIDDEQVRDKFENS